MAHRGFVRGKQRVKSNQIIHFQVSEGACSSWREGADPGAEPGPAGAGLAAEVRGGREEPVLQVRGSDCIPHQCQGSGGSANLQSVFTDVMLYSNMAVGLRRLTWISRSVTRTMRAHHNHALEPQMEKFMEKFMEKLLRTIM